MTAAVDPPGTRAGPDERARPGLSAAAALVAEVVGGRPRVRWTQAWPIVLRPTGPRRVHLVHGAGGPLGGDRLAVDVRVEAGAELAVRSAGATIVQPGRGGAEARWRTTLTAGPGAGLDWAPEPSVVTDGAVFASSLRVALAEDASAVVREVVVLGRHGQRGGRYRGRLDVTVGAAALLANETRLDGADPVLGGLGGTAGFRAVGTLVIVRPGALGTPGCAPPGDSGAAASGEEPRVRWAWTELAGPGHVLLAVGDPGAVVDVLDAAAAALPRA